MLNQWKDGKLAEFAAIHILHNDEQNTRMLQDAQPFLDWINQADDEEGEEDEEEQEEEDA